MTESSKETGAAQPRARHSQLGVKRVRPAYQQVADQLLDLILTGQLAAGHRLPPEADLAASFGVSRSTVREALRALASRDLIETTRGTTGGTFVRRVDMGRVRDYLETSIGRMAGAADLSVEEMLEAREVLEVPAARLAAHRRDEDHVTQLWETIEREKQTRERGLRFREHKNFHGIVVRASGNGLLELMTAPVFHVLQSKFLSPAVPSEYWATVDDDHREIAERIEAGDGEGAAAAMSAHLKRLRPTYEEAS